ncbi:MAG TPA: Flp family type IVb pilin [Methylocystis sp.]|nr:Flp family type IVb pilin [Methylocystis sp.]
MHYFLTRFCIDESGAVAIEYGFILALISIGIVIATQRMGAWAVNVFDAVGNNLTTS